VGTARQLALGAALARRFGLELATLAALAVAGFRSGAPFLVRAALGLGAPVVAAIMWGRYASPKAPHRLQGAAHLAVELLVFGSGVAALALVGESTWAWALGALHVADRGALAVLERPASVSREPER